MARSADDERAALPRTSATTKAFARDWLRLSRSGRYDMRRLKEAMLLLIARDAPLGAEWSNHALKGVWRGHHECRIGGDLPLIYRLDDGAGDDIVFVRAGTHAELFE